MEGASVMLAVGLLLWGLTTVQPASVRVKAPEGCSISSFDMPAPNQLLNCQITTKNVNKVIYEMKKPPLLSIGLQLQQSIHVHFHDEAFHPNLQYLEINGFTFSLSHGTFRGLSNLKVLSVITHVIIEPKPYNTTIYPLDINYTSPVLGAGWLTPLTNLQMLSIRLSNISSFRVEEFCSLHHLQTLDLSYNRINSLEGLGITCNSSSCAHCLPNITNLNISGNPFGALTVNISRNLPNLSSLDLSHCDLSALNINDATTEYIEELHASNNKLRSLVIDEEVPSNRPRLQKLFLDNNKLQIISPSLFSWMQHLQTLNLSTNALTEETLISAGLNKLTELKRLDLSHNNLHKLQTALIGNIPELVGFWCSACQLTVIEHDTFSYTKNLRYLVLDKNYLSMIEGRLLSNFLSLNLLDLSWNALKEITLTENLISLRELDLSDNLLSEIPDFPGLWLNLSTFTMNRNLITHIGPKQQSGPTNLKMLSLAFNNIEFIPDDTFTNQRMLETLILSSNKIRIISEFGFNKIQNLRHLSLDKNFLKKLPSLNLPTLPNIVFLNFSGNLIKTINQLYGRSLKEIDLSHNQISQIKCLFGFFDHLQYVNLSYNQLTTIPFQYFSTNMIPRPNVYLQGNPLHIDCHSEWLLDTKLDKTDEEIQEYKMNIYEIKKDWTKPFYPKLEDTDPAKSIHNKARTSRYFKIADWDLLQGTTLTGERRFFSELSRSDFVCEYRKACSYSDCAEDCCTDLSSCPCTYFCPPECTCYYHKLNMSIDVMNCSSRDMTSLPTGGPSYVTILTLDGNNLTSINSSSLNFPRLTKLSIANSHISHLQPGAFSKLRMVRILHLENNNIENINNQTFAFLKNLEELYLHGNKIHKIDKGSFDDLLQLKTLWLHGNNLRYLHLSLLDRMNSLSELTLQDNPWSCDCQSGPAFKKWLIHSEIIVNHSHIYCNNTAPSYSSYSTGPDSSQYNIPDITNATALSQHYPAVIDVDLTGCDNRTVRIYHRTIIERVHSKVITEIVSLAAVFTILIILILVIFKTHLLIRVWIYNKFGVRFREEDDDNDDKPYDLFIAYAKTDERLVMYDLLPKLEGKGMSYKVCLECRDWPPGAATTDSVVASVQLSKRTIVLVTPNHLDKQWCEYSFDAAHYQVLKDKQIRLILVLSDIELKTRMTRAMKLYMKTNTFLVIGERWFWKKLRYYLADNPRGADYVVGREFRLMNAY